MVLFTAITNLFYLYIPNKWFLLSYNIIFGAFGGITFMTLLAFFVHIIPTGSEALMYALVTSTNNFFTKGGNFLGGVIYDNTNYSTTVIISSLCTFLCLLFIPYLQIRENKVK
jgi:predicted MFS family arabinose efflux permease